MEKFDFLTKTLVNSFSYTTVTKNREAYSDVNIDGRLYTKWGTLQAVTIVGNLYEDHRGNQILMCGISWQHPCDTKCDKQTAYEISQYRALFDPNFIFNTIPENFDNHVFSEMMKVYVDAMDLKFIKTKKEIENSGKNPQNYNR